MVAILSTGIWVNALTLTKYRYQPYTLHSNALADMPLQNLENQEISGKKPGDLTKNQEIVSNKFCSLSHFKLCIFSIIFNM